MSPNIWNCFDFLNDLTCWTFFIKLLIFITILGFANLPKVTSPNNEAYKADMSST